MTREELREHCNKQIKFNSIESKLYQEHRLTIDALQDQEKYENLIINTHDLLKLSKETYETLEKLYNKELRKERKEILREELIRLDKRIKVYKEILK